MEPTLTESKSGGQPTSVFLKITMKFKDSLGDLIPGTAVEMSLKDATYFIEQSPDKEANKLAITGTFECTPYPKTVTLFLELKEDKVLCVDTEEDPKLKDFFERFYQPAVAEIKRIFKLIRWKYQLGEGKINYYDETIFWSFDQKNWRSISRCPAPENLRVKMLHTKKLDVGLLQDLMVRDIHEPIFFELLREANSISETSLDSAFVIAVAALEVSVKYLIKNHLPETVWIMDEIPTPPIERIVREYYPTFLTGFKLSEEDSKTFKNIVATRNKIVHAGDAAQSRAWLFEKLRFINQFISQTIDPHLK